MTFMMTKDEYRAALSQLGLTQAQAGRLLNVAERSSRRYATEDDTIPGPVENIVRLWLDRPELMKWFDNLADQRDREAKTAAADIPAEMRRDVTARAIKKDVK